MNVECQTNLMEYLQTIYKLSKQEPRTQNHIIQLLHLRYPNINYLANIFNQMAQHSYCSLVRVIMEHLL